MGKRVPIRGLKRIRRIRIETEEGYMLREIR